jgi:hypothetical protein
MFTVEIWLPRHPHDFEEPFPYRDTHRNESSLDPSPLAFKFPFKFTFTSRLTRATRASRGGHYFDPHGSALSGGPECWSNWRSTSANTQDTQTWFILLQPGSSRCRFLTNGWRHFHSSTVERADQSRVIVQPSERPWARSSPPAAVEKVS